MHYSQNSNGKLPIDVPGMKRMMGPDPEIGRDPWYFAPGEPVITEPFAF